ncbi:uncharacterized protein LACBIDRAFT_322724 [Laccaria bicolor S238N-H82]|uniref:Predicted protein n=1 Tax=Laccaria bicolor (strain S238N-H82 / ATCC MYA-4686) TaxID=486041 RepID=B0CXA7_LACBS|nr:uncharacterized protein LACBIDRAFT_322724 [Laccaria bicolor S238N-H82]EDR13638.1 predicted protein [Laccaria bicolor S238N-H82]|eukprot:XP_001876136.1 predicted protein [Laccaria bicolor S238N-H82]
MHPELLEFQDDIDARLPLLGKTMSLPLELVQEIIHLLLFSAPPRSSTPEDPGNSTKPRWGTIDALSLTSQSCRALVLEAWFRTLYIESPEDLIFLRESGWFPELESKWTRHLHCVLESFSNAWNLSAFLQVSSIRLDWLPPCANLGTLPFLHLSCTVEHFDLRGKWWPTPEAVQTITDTPGFGCLKTLKMELDTVWCGICQMCCLFPFKGRPTGVVYEGGLGLPFDYARVLAPLEYLEEVVIITPNYRPGWTTLALNADTNPETTPTSDRNVNPNLWSGECDICVRVAYKDDAFREKWVARKRHVGLAYGDGDNDDGEKGLRPPRLRRVEYRSQKSSKQPTNSRLMLFLI